MSAVVSQARPDSAGRGSRLHHFLTTGVGRSFVWATVLFWSVPTFGLLLSSIRKEGDIKTTGWWTFFSHPSFTLDNYRSVLDSKSGGGAMWPYFLNSVKITLPGTFIPVLVAAFAAYAFSWMSFKGRDWLFVFVVGLGVVPLQMCLIPLLQLFNHGAHLGSVTIFPYLHLNKSVATIWLAHTIFALPLAVFLLRNFIGQLPVELIEAARVDGASHLTIFTRIIVPLSVPALASLTIFQFLWVWNDLLVGLTFGGLSPERSPMTARLVDLVGSRGQEWHLLTAGAFVTMLLPLCVFFGLQRFFVRGLVTGAVKG
jgi:alpha-glucoside transport system permease protein